MDMKLLMQQAQEMQSKIQKAQADLSNKEFEGNSGGGLIKAIISGSGEVKKISIDNSLINPNEKDVLEDLIVAAINSAKKNADEGSAAIMKEVAGGVNLPEGFKF